MPRFLHLFFFFTIDTFIHHSFLHKYSLMPISISSQLSARWGEPPWGGVPPGRDSNSSLPFSKPADYQLSHIAHNILDAKYFSISHWITAESVFILYTRSTFLQHVLFLLVSCMLIVKNSSFRLDPKSSILTSEDPSRIRMRQYLNPNHRL